MPGGARAKEAYISDIARYYDSVVTNHAHVAVTASVKHRDKGAKVLVN